MLEFIIKSRSCNRYHLPSRVADCEPSLVLFNCFTPMAVCVEIIIKQAGLDGFYYLNEYDVNRDNKTGVAALMDKTEIRKVLYTWGIDDRLIEEVKAKINEPNNRCKHRLEVDPVYRSAAWTRESFKVFYKFISLYYKHCTGTDAPEWKEEDYLQLYERIEKTFVEKNLRIYDK